MDFILEALQFLGIIALVVLVFNVLIVVHELGHFLAAKWRGLKVEKFQIWFGKLLWKKEIDGVQFGLGSIPAGGFVALPQMAPMELIEGQNDGEEGPKSEPLPPITPLDKIIVAIAGPVFSMGLACVFAFFVWIVGHPVSKAGNSTVIGFVFSGSPAEKAGLKPGDNILEVGNEPVKTFQGMVDSVTWNIIKSEGEQIPFKVDRPGVGEVELTVTKEKRDAVDGEKKGGVMAWISGLVKRPKLRKVGIGPEVTPNIVAELRPYSPAEEAGIAVGDDIVGMNGEKLYHAGMLSQYAAEHSDKPLTLTLLRDGSEMEVEVTPRMPDKPGTVAEAEIGIRKFDREYSREVILEHPPVHVQIVNTLRTMANTISAVASPKSDIDIRHLSGPVGIMHLYYRLFQSPDGWRLVLWFSVLLNVNLAVLNMLPLPVLDGGHITLALIEAVTRRNINLKVLEFVQTACALLLISFMLFVTLFDTGDIMRGDGETQENREPEFLPRGAASDETAGKNFEFAGVIPRRAA